MKKRKQINGMPSEYLFGQLHDNFYNKFGESIYSWAIDEINGQISEQIYEQLCRHLYNHLENQTVKDLK